MFPCSNPPPFKAGDPPLSPLNQEAEEEAAAAGSFSTRKRKWPSSSVQQEIASSQLNEATRAQEVAERLSGDAKSDLSVLAEHIQYCFGISSEECTQKIGQQGEVSVQNLATLSFALARARIRSAKPVATEEIIQIHSLFFETELESISKTKLAYEMPGRAHITKIFQSLFSCVQAVKPYGTCESAVAVAQTCFEKKPIPTQGISFLLRLSSSQRESVLAELGQSEERREEADKVLRDFQEYKDAQQAFESDLKKCPVTRTEDVFGGDNANKTYALRDATGKAHWIFKPVGQGLNASSIIEAEHTASLVNVHNQFPIPTTVLIEIGGWTGSAQCFIDGATDVEGERFPESSIVLLDLQKLIIFDLLFGNCDRNENNLLFKKVGGVFRAYGIDHDWCFAMRDIASLRLSYLSFNEFEEPFNPCVKDLITEEVLQEYAQGIEIHGENRTARDWMWTATKHLREAIRTNKSVKATIAEIEIAWEEMQFGPAAEDYPC